MSRNKRGHFVDSRRPVNQPIVLSDKLENLVTGMSQIGQDKTASNRYALTILPQPELDNAYRGDWIAGKAIDIVADDATSEWRAWNATADQITAIEATENRLGVSKKVNSALKKARLYGGSAIVIGVRGDAKMDLPLNPERVKKNGIEYLNVVTRHQLSHIELDWDIASPYFGRPKMYTYSTPNGTTINIHPSRIVRFVGREVPSEQVTGYDGWGDSIIQRIDDAIKHAAIPQQQIATLMMESNVDIIKIPGLMANVSTEQYRNKLLTRWHLAAVAKSANRALMLDSEEEWNKLSPNFSGLRDLAMMYLETAAAACGIVATRFLEKSPDGLNATGKGDLENHYKMVSNFQCNEMAPEMKLLDECLIFDALGSRPEEIYYTWRPLWNLSEIQKTDNFLKKTQAIVNLVNTGLYSPEELKPAVTNMLTEDGIMPGIEQIDPDDEIDETDPEAKEQFDQSKK